MKGVIAQKLEGVAKKKQIKKIDWLNISLQKHVILNESYFESKYMPHNVMNRYSNILSLTSMDRRYHHKNYSNWRMYCKDLEYRCE